MAPLHWSYDSDTDTMFDANDVQSIGVSNASTSQPFDEIRHNESREDEDSMGMRAMAVSVVHETADAMPHITEKTEGTFSTAGTPVEDNTSLTKEMLHASMSSSLPNDKLCKMGIEVVEDVFDVIDMPSCNSGELTSSESLKRSWVSPPGSSNNPTTESSARLTAQSKDILRLRGGRGQGPLDTFAEGREVVFGLRGMGKEESSELESLDAMSGSWKVDLRQHDLASYHNNDNDLFVGNKQDDLRNLVGRVGGTEAGSSLSPRAGNARSLDSAAFQEEACSILAQLAVMYKTETTILEAGGVIAILGAMQQHEVVAKVQECGCSALHIV